MRAGRAIGKRTLARAMATITVLLAALAACAGSAPRAADLPYHHLPGGGFRNPPGSPPRLATFADMSAFFFRRMAAPDPVAPAGHALPREDALAGLAAAAGRDSITWLGHSTFLIRLGGKTILTDPYLGRVAGPLGLGPERYVAPGIPLEDLPPVDIVVVSHNHYDHLDASTVTDLPGKERIEVVVPLELGDFFRDRGYSRVHEKDWYESIRFGPLEVEMLPAVHFSSRTPFDRNRTLWAGYALRAGERRLFHSGDTGYGPVFREIGRRAGPFDVAMVAIGAYAPRRIMRSAHVTPEEAVRLVDDIGAATAIGMHWGTVVLTDEPAFEPPERFRAAARAAGWPDSRALTFRIGETRTLDSLAPAS